VPGALLAQDRQGRLGHPQRAEHVGRELRADLLLDRPEQAVAGVDDDDVQAAEATVGGADASLEAVARRAGIGIGTPYRHFPTRGPPGGVRRASAELDAPVRRFVVS
jgi:hypothetical protein